MSAQVRPLVVIVEDDPSLSAFLRRLLTGAGYEIALAADKAQADVLAGGRRPDLLLIDIVLPDARGWDLGPRLWPGVPFVLMTGALVDDDSRRDAELLGAKAIVQKPFTPEQMLEVVRAFVGGL